MSEKKEAGFKGIFIAIVVSMLIALLWDSFSFIKNFAHSILDPTAGWFLNWNLVWGMLILVFLISLIMTLIQKYLTDQKALKEMKERQKALQEEMKKHKGHPEKLMEMQKEMFKFMPRMMKLSMRGVVYTAIPLILLFRWFFDFFSVIEDYRFFGIFSWFWIYILGSIIFSSILRKVLDVV